MAESSTLDPMIRTTTIKAFLLLSLLGLVWGVGYSIAGFVLAQGVSPVAYTFWQTLGPAVCLSFYCMYQKEDLLGSFGQHIGFFALLGFLGLALPNVIMYIVLSYIPSGLVAVIVNTVPIFTYIIALLLKEESFMWKKAGAVLLCFAGIFLIKLLTNAPSVHDLHTPWVLLALLPPLCFASSSVMIARFSPKALSPYVLATCMLWTAFCWIVPWMLWHGEMYVPTLPFSLKDGAILLEIVLSSLGYILLFTLIRLAGSVYYGFVGGVTACVALLWGYWLLDERFSWGVLLGILCILLSLVIINRLLGAHKE